MNRRQELFVAEYLVTRNAREAAERAGYSPNRAKQTGSELLRKPHIAQALAAADKERREKLGVDADWIVSRLVAVHEKAFAGSVRVDKDGAPIEVDGVRLTEWSPSGATKPLELLMRQTGLMSPEKHEVTVSGEVVYTLTLDRTLPELEDADEEE